MRTILKNVTKSNIFLLTLLIFGAIVSSSCKKVISEEPSKISEKIPPVYAYEVTCNYCNITYTDASNQNKTINTNVGKWSYKITKKISFDLKLKVETILSNYQSIEAYILKDDEVIYGSLGYNQADVSYNTSLATGTSRFGSYISSGTSGGNGSGGNSSGGTTAPISSVCGARNKTGGFCKRLVSGGGRCWQHR